MHHPCKIARPELLARFDSNHAVALATRQRLLAEWAGSGVLVVGTHFVAPVAGYVRSEQGSYRFEN